MAGFDASVRCAQCETMLAPLRSFACVKNKQGCHLVAALANLSDNVASHRPHPDGARLPFKRGKLSCVCNENLGNIQSDMNAVLQSAGLLGGKHEEVAVLKFATIRFAVDPMIPYITLSAAKLGQAIGFSARPNVRDVRQVEPNHVLSAAGRPQVVGSRCGRSGSHDTAANSGDPDLGRLAACLEAHVQATGSVKANSLQAFYVQVTTHEREAIKGFKHKGCKDGLQAFVKRHCAGLLIEGAGSELRLVCTGVKAQTPSSESGGASGSNSSAGGTSSRVKGLNGGVVSGSDGGGGSGIARPFVSRSKHVVASTVCDSKVHSEHRSQARSDEEELVNRTMRLLKQEESNAAARDKVVRQQAAVRDRPSPVLTQAPHLVAPQQRAAETHRRLFDKATKTRDFTFKGERDAERFADAMEAYHDQDLPWRLTNRSEYGTRHMVEAAQTGGVNATMAMVRALMSPNWKDQKFAIALGECVRELSAGYAVVERLTHAVQQQHIQTAIDLKALGDFCSTAAFALGSVKLAEQEERDGVLSSLAQELVTACRGREDAKAALGRAENVKVTLTKALMTAKKMQEVEKEVAVAADRLREINLNHLPGGRHSNDHADFREINVVPTIEELVAREQPFLPRANGEVFLADDPETQLLDRQFRLLREDLIATVRDALAKGTGFSIRLAVEIHDLEFHTFYRRGDDKSDEPKVFHGRGVAGLQFWLSSKAGKTLAEDLQRRRQLQPGSLALLRDGDSALAIGRVVEPFRTPNDLNKDTDKQIGIAFDDPTLLSLIKLGRGRLLELVPVPGSFFAYEPVLLCLQKLNELPFRHELLLEDVNVPRPPIYAGVGLLMGQLGKPPRLHCSHAPSCHGRF